MKWNLRKYQSKMDSKLKIIFFGTPSFVAPVLEILRKDFDLIGVVTSPDSIQGRKGILTPSPIKILGEENNIQIFEPEKLDATFLEDINALNIDLFVVAAYGKIIPQMILDIPRLGSINIHPSLLPLYRGPSPIQTALLNGDKESGISIIKMDEKMDHGPIISQWEFPIQPNDTFAKLRVSMFKGAALKLPAIINDFAKKKLIPTPQDDSKATYCQIITRDNGYFEWDNPPSPENLDRMIRAYFPWPTAWSKYRGVSGKELIVKFYPEKRIQLEGGKPMNLEDFFNGHPEMKEKVTAFLGMNE